MMEYNEAIECLNQMRQTIKNEAIDIAVNAIENLAEKSKKPWWQDCMSCKNRDNWKDSEDIEERKICTKCTRNNFAPSGENKEDFFISLIDK